MKTGQNTSSNVMQQRADRDDKVQYFPTPPWATRIMLEFLKNFFPLARQSVWEPACGEGYMSRPMAEYFKTVHATDMFDYSRDIFKQDAVQDFLLDWPGEEEGVYDWIITNPPFELAERFIKLGLKRSRVGVAVLVRTSFIEGKTRYRDLFSKHWPSFYLQYVERVPMHQGRMDPSGTTATTYCWLIWVKPDVRKKIPAISNSAPQLFWLAPSRKTFEKRSDYLMKPMYEQPVTGFDFTEEPES